MSTREFHHHDHTSSTFWRITVTGHEYTVQSGRIGTPGQTQTTTFPDEQAAQAASEQQIVEKLKQGYHEVVVSNDDQQAPAETPMPSFLSRLVTAVLARLKRSTPMPSTQSELLAAGPLQPPASAIDHPGSRVNLDPTDWFWATWRRPAPLQRPTAIPFDRADALGRLRQLSNSALQWQWKWETVIPEVVTREEALFWLQALQAAHESNTITPAAIADRLATSDAKRSISREQALALALRSRDSIQPRMIALLATLFSPREMMAWLIDVYRQPLPGHSHWYTTEVRLIEGFRRYVLPYLSHRERDQLSQALTRHLQHVPWPAAPTKPGHPALYLAAMLGGHHDVLRRIVESWADDSANQHPLHYYYQGSQELIFGLDDPREVEAHVRRLNLPLREPRYVRAWLAHTEDRALDVVRASIQADPDRTSAAALLSAFALVDSPAAAPHMLALTQESKAPQVASAWIDEHPAHTIAGLLPLADGRGAQAEAATEVLRRLVRRGYAAMIEQSLADVPEAVAARQRATIIAGAHSGLLPFDDHTTPEWLAEALRSLRHGRQAKLPTWARGSDLPPITVGAHVLNTEQQEGVLRAVQRSKTHHPQPLIQRLKQHADPASLDRFAWSLFERWLAEGAPSKENWAFFGLGWLGGDSVALRLPPLIRIWPGQSQHQRAVNGLECLRLIGSDTALMQINSIAQQVKFKGLQNRAVECMQQIAEERGLSRAQLEDRIVPDCGLDARGGRIFNYGTRQFRFVLGPEMKPMVRDPQGKLKPNLPPPTSKDDPEQAAQALAEWKLLKKQVAEVARVQAVRLEQAMVAGRRWSRVEFETLLVRHPLMTHLVRTLIWGVYDSEDVPRITFRVTEDQSYADAADETCELPADAEIGLVHALHLTAEDRGAWGELLSDYEIVQPFPQLGRTILRLEAHELTATEMTRFKELKIPAATLVFGLDKLGWTRDLPGDGGGIFGHFKPFYGFNMTAVIHYMDGVAPGYIVEAGDQTIVYVAIVPGIRKAEYYPKHTDRLLLSEVDPVVISEVLNDIRSLAAKAP